MDRPMDGVARIEPLSQGRGAKDGAEGRCSSREGEDSPPCSHSRVARRTGCGRGRWCEVVDESSRVSAGAPGQAPGAFPRPEAERLRLMARLSQLRPFGLEAIQLYVGFVALAGAGLVSGLVLV